MSQSDLKSMSLAKLGYFHRYYFSLKTVCVLSSNNLPLNVAVIVHSFMIISELVFYCKLITSMVKLSNAKWHPKDTTRYQKFS